MKSFIIKNWYKLTTTVLLTLIVFYLRDGVRVKGWIDVDVVGMPAVNVQSLPLDMSVRVENYPLYVESVR